ncbi:MAG: DUF952 domain-containing protein [Candidatus Promineifilaceae bacterium]
MTKRWGSIKIKRALCQCELREKRKTAVAANTPLSDNGPMTILHITTENEWQTAVAAGQYRADSLESEGFIHCSTIQQVLMPANQMYAGRSDLILLTIDPAKLTAKLVYEDCYETGHQFPHIYGPLNLDAVTGFVAFPPNPDGTFSLPAGLA